jgi:hypothetical protein
MGHKTHGQRDLKKSSSKIEISFAQWGLSEEILQLDTVLGSFNSFGRGQIQAKAS